VEFDISVRAMAQALGDELAEVADWSCCGATAAHALSRDLGLALPARNLALARQQGFDQLLAPCAACFNRLRVTADTFGEDAAARARIEDIVEMPLGEMPKVWNLVQYLQAYGLDALRQRVSRPLAGLRPACYYGCLLLRPAKRLGFDDPEQPASMEAILKALGAEPVDWPLRNECCGGGFTISKPEAVLRLAGAVLQDAHAHGAQALVVACPMCHTNLDMRQRAIERAVGKRFRLPVYFLSEAVAWALGVPASELALRKHLVRTPEPDALVRQAAGGM
jgi:heterodisulfide reductase subunit B